MKPTCASAALLSLLVLLAMPAPGSSSVLYVKNNAPGPAHDGLSWTSAFLKVQDGLNASLAGDEVWVSAGAYSERITMKDGVALYGGFAGTETARDQRDPAVHVAGLEGGGKGTVVTVPSGATASTILDGFTVANGAPATGTDNGGAVVCSGASPTLSHNTFQQNIGHTGVVYSTGSGASPFITDNTFTGNSAGSYPQSGQRCGVVYCSGSVPVIQRNTFTKNTGSSVTCDNGAAPRIEGNEFAGNTSTSGGAILCLSSSPTITGNSIVENQASTGGAIYASAGAPVIANNRILRNNASYDGGALYLTSSSAAVVRNNIIAANAAPSLNFSSSQGGAIYCSGSGAVIVNNTIVSNNAHGGAVKLNGGTQTFSNNILAFNSSNLVSNAMGVPHRNVIYANPPDNPYETVTGDNIHADPTLAGTPYGDYHIQPDSPCLDAGDDSLLVDGGTDIDGQARKQGSHVDIGADESDGTLWNVAPRVVFVRPGAPAGNSGSSWAEATGSLSNAVYSAWQAGGADIWVAEGIYQETFLLRSLARLYGGFDGTETAIGQRDAAVHPTILEPAPNNVFAVASLAGCTSAAVDGFTINASPAVNIATGALITVSTCNLTGGVGDGVYADYFSIPVVSDCAISGYAKNGIECYNAAFPKVLRCRVTGNSTGLILSNGGGVVANCLFAGNQADGIDATGQDSIVNNTVSCNGGAGLGLGAEQGTVANNIFAFNGQGVANPNGGTTVPTFSNNDAYGNTSGGYSGIPDPTGASGNVSADPLFVDRVNGDFHLATGSPCLDAGNDALAIGPSTLDGMPRTLGAHVDIGAYEAAVLNQASLADAAAALRAAGGLANITEADRDRLNVQNAGPSAGVVDIADAARLARRALGLDPA